MPQKANNAASKVISWRDRPEIAEEVFRIADNEGISKQTAFQRLLRTGLALYGTVGLVRDHLAEERIRQLDSMAHSELVQNRQVARDSMLLYALYEPSDLEVMAFIRDAVAAQIRGDGNELLRRLQLEADKGLRSSWEETLPQGLHPVKLPVESHPSGDVVPIDEAAFVVRLGSALAQEPYSITVGFGDNVVNVIDGKLLRHQVLAEQSDASLVHISVQGAVSYELTTNDVSLRVVKGILNNDGEYDSYTLVGTYLLARTAQSLVVALPGVTLAMDEEKVTYHDPVDTAECASHELRAEFDPYLIVVDMGRPSVQAYRRTDGFLG